MAVTAEDVERTARDTAAAQWSVAAVVMVGSAAAAGFTFHYLGEHWALGVLTALAVDLALAAWLRIDGRLRAVGIRSTAGIVLECVTVVQTLFLNIGAAVFRGIDKGSAAARWLLGFAHTFLPIELLLITLAGGSAQLSLMRLHRERAAEERTKRDAQLAAERAEHEARQMAARTARDLAAEVAQARNECDVAQREVSRLHRDIDQLRADLEQQTVTTQSAREQLVAAHAEIARLGKQQTKSSDKHDRAPSNPSAGSRKARREWWLDEYAEGRERTGGEVDFRFNVELGFGGPRTGTQVVKEARQQLAEQRRGSIHAVGGRN